MKKQRFVLFFIVATLALFALTDCTIYISAPPTSPSGAPTVAQPIPVVVTQIPAPTLTTEGKPQSVQIIFSANRTRLKSGECATLKWDVQGGFGVTLNEQVVNRFGEQQVCPQETTTYALAVDAGIELKISRVVIEVEGAGQAKTPANPPPAPPQPQPQPLPAACPGPPVITSFTANPDTIEVLPTTTGQSTLSWGAVLNATSAVIDQGIGGIATPGSTVRTLDKTTTFTLTATGCGGTTTKQVTIVVKTKVFPVTMPSVDLAVTDLYPDNMPKGEVWVRITNNGPDSLTNASANLSCTAIKTNYATGAKFTEAKDYAVQITLSLKPGETQAFSTRVLIDATAGWYDFSCRISSSITDPKPANNNYSEKFPPPP